MTPILSAQGYALGKASPKRAWVNHYIAAQSNEGVDFSGLDSGKRDAEDMRYYARQTLPEGIDADKVDFSDLDPNHLANFKAQLATGKPLYGATVVHGGCSARFDALIPDPVNGGHKLLGISAVCSVKPEHVDRLAFQTWLLDQIDVPVTSQAYVHLNGEFVKNGNINPAELIKHTDITDLVGKAVNGTSGPLAKGEKAVVGVAETVTKLMSVLANSSKAPVEPETFCPEIDEQNLPKHHIHTLTNLRAKKARTIMELGHTDLAKLPPSVELSPTQLVQVEAIKTGKPQMDRAKLGIFFSKLQYPLQYLDFESIQTAVPMYDQSFPYQQIPVQFSLHTVDSPGATPRHKEFLSESAEDARPAFFTALRDSLEKGGTIVCYNSTFEVGRLKEGAEQFPEHAEWLNKAMPRVEDLLAPFRSYAYYHPEQKGSTSIKAVLPALTGQSYDQMVIGDGQTASREYMRMVFSDVSREEAAAIATNLKAYCGKDTRSLVDVHEIVENDMLGLRKGREPISRLALAPAVVSEGMIPGSAPAFMDFA